METGTGRERRGPRKRSALSSPWSVPPGGERLTDLGLLALAVIWGINFSVIKVGLEEVPPLAFNALRFPLAAGVLYLLLRSRGPLRLPRKEDLPFLIFLGLLGNVVYQLFFIFGMDLTLAGNAALLLATTPVWTTVFSTVWGDESPGPLTWIGVCATVAGMALVIGGGEARLAVEEGTLGGDLLMLFSSVLWAIYTVGGRPLTRRYGSLQVTAWTLWIATPGLVLLGVPSLLDTPLSEVSPGVWAAIGYAGILAIGIAYVLWYRGVQRIGSSRTAVFSNLVPVVALLTAWLWLAEVPSGLQLAGAAVILAGITVARFSRPESPGEASPTTT